LRKDKRRLHSTRHGVLSKHPLETLVRLGENVRQLRRIQSMLRAELQPIGILAEILFDRAWACYLRCILIARTETNILMPNNHPVDAANRIPTLQEAQVPTLVYDHGELNNFSIELLKHLAVVQRYDSHFSREFYRAIGLLLALRNAGQTGLAQQLAKTIGQGKNSAEG
jgi:hypothetical protein